MRYPCPQRFRPTGTQVSAAVLAYEQNLTACGPHWAMLAAIEAANMLAEEEEHPNPMDTRKLCTCGSPEACGIRRGDRLGELWRCMAGRENPA